MINPVTRYLNDIADYVCHNRICKTCKYIGKFHTHLNGEKVFPVAETFPLTGNLTVCGMWPTTTTTASNTGTAWTNATTHAIDFSGVNNEFQ